MDFHQLVHTRFSVRSYQDCPIEEDKLERILEAARIAPSAANRQPWQFIVVRDPEMRQALKRAYGREWFYNAPVVIAACGLPDEAYVRQPDQMNFMAVDVTIAMDHLILAAAAEGLGTCWIGAHDEQAAKEALGVPDNVRIVTMTPLGYPDQELGPKTRKSLDQIVRYDRW